MEIVIKETGAIKDLTIIGINNIEWTADLINASDFYNTVTEQHEMSQDDFDWWKEFIDDYKADAQEIEDLANELNIDESEILDRINEELKHSNDLGDQHTIKKNVIQEFREV